MLTRRLPAARCRPQEDSLNHLRQRQSMQSLQMQMPMYGMGMGGMGMGGMADTSALPPLLPPSAPFMMQSYGPRRPSSQNSQRQAPQSSQSSSPTMSRQHLPSNASSERVNRQSGSYGAPAPASARRRHD